MYFSEMIESFQRGAVPRWLIDYLKTNQSRIATQLLFDGVATIPSPDRSVIVTIRMERP